jgi:methylated-DNA-[protein]-cysteine S-methyltransferase
MTKTVKTGIGQVNKKIIKSTPFGSVGIVWHIANNLPRIVSVLLSRPGLPAEDRASVLFPDSRKSSCAEIDETAVSIKAFLEGENVKFSLNSVDLSQCTKFQQSVLRAQHAIPRGLVSTYGLIAVYAGAPGGARAAGNALAGNPFPIIVPCHRTILSDFRLGGFGGGSEMKRALLKREGVIFDDAGRVICARLHYSQKE